jgi:hypothetical protein
VNAPAAPAPTGQQQYLSDLLRCYILLPHTPHRPSRNDRRIALQLFTRQVPIDAIKTAFVLAISRRTFRSPDALPLEPIRSLAYFLPVINEVQKADLDPVYIDLLKHRLETGFPDLGVPPLDPPIPW